jgi:hypothetical protein
MSSIDNSNPANLGGHGITRAHLSPQEEFYRMEVLKKKLDYAPPGVDKDKILAQMSERDMIKLHILDRLADIRESSPEWALVVSMTHTEDRFEQAEVMSKKVYDKLVADRFYDTYTLSKATAEQFFDDADTKAIAVRRKAQASRSPAAAAVGGAISGLLGGGSSSGSAAPAST